VLMGAFDDTAADRHALIAIAVMVHPLWVRSVVAHQVSVRVAPSVGQHLGFAPSKLLGRLGFPER
jgi:hypothetical protein